MVCFKINRPIPDYQCLSILQEEGKIISDCGTCQLQ